MTNIMSDLDPKFVKYVQDILRRIPAPAVGHKMCIGVGGKIFIGDKEWVEPDEHRAEAGEG